MAALEHTFYELACQYRIAGMSVQRSWTEARKKAAEMGAVERGSRDDVPINAPAPPGVDVYPPLPGTESAIRTTAHQFFKKPKIVTRMHELRQQQRAEEIPDGLTYVKCILQEIIGRCMQEIEVKNARGKKVGVYDFRPSEAIRAGQAYMQAIKLQAEMGDQATGETNMDDLKKQLDRLKKEVFGERAGKHSPRHRNPEGTSQHEDPSVSALQ